LPLNFSFLIRIYTLFSSISTHQLTLERDQKDLQVDPFVHWMRTEWVLTLPIGFIPH
jgi:hypothetical protein